VKEKKKDSENEVKTNLEVIALLLDLEQEQLLVRVANPSPRLKPSHPKLSLNRLRNTTRTTMKKTN